MARPWCDPHPLVYLFVPQKERALSRNQKPESTHEYVLLAYLLTYLPERLGWCKKKTLLCSSSCLNPAPPKSLTQTVQRQHFLGCLYKGWSIEWSSRRGECVPTHLAEPAHCHIQGTTFMYTPDWVYLHYIQSAKQFFNNSLMCVSLSFCLLKHAQWVCLICGVSDFFAPSAVVVQLHYVWWGNWLLDVTPNAEGQQFGGSAYVYDLILPSKLV